MSSTATSTTPSLFGTRSLDSSSVEPSESSSAAADDAPSPQIRTQTPIIVCEPASYNFTGGTPPYQDLYIIKSGQSEADIFHTLPKDEQPGEGSWGVDVKPGISITFVIRDALDKYGYSEAVVVEDAKDHSCLPAQKAESKTTKILGGVLGAIGGLLLIALLIWWFIVRPGHLRHSSKEEPKKFTYEDGDTPVAQAVELSAPHSLRSNPNLLSKTGVEFNLDSVPMRRHHQEGASTKSALPSYSSQSHNEV